MPEEDKAHACYSPSRALEVYPFISVSPLNSLQFACDLIIHYRRKSCHHQAPDIDTVGLTELSVDVLGRKEFHVC